MSNFLYFYALGNNIVQVFFNMKVLKAKIKKTSPHYEKGLNLKGKPVWLTITGFKSTGTKNYRINAIKGISGGFAQYEEIWLSKDELLLKHIEDGQLAIELYSSEEFEEQKYNPKFYNRKRFEIVTETERQYIQAPDLKKARQIANELGFVNFKIRQVKKLTNKEINDK